MTALLVAALGLLVLTIANTFRYAPRLAATRAEVERLAPVPVCELEQAPVVSAYPVDHTRGPLLTDEEIERQAEEWQRECAQVRQVRAEVA